MLGIRIIGLSYDRGFLVLRLGNDAGDVIGEMKIHATIEPFTDELEDFLDFQDSGFDLAVQAEKIRT